MKEYLLAIVAKTRNEILFDTCFTSNGSTRRQRSFPLAESDLNPSKSLPLSLKGPFLKGLIKQDLADKEIVDHLFSLLCASLHSTANIASFMCLLLAQHPQIQERLRHEIFMTTGMKPSLACIFS